MKIVLGQILALTKAVRLQPKEPGDHGWTQFIAGKKSSSGFRSGIGLTWWSDEDTTRALEAVATLVITGRPEFKDCDLASVTSVVLETLQEICLDNSIFVADDVFAMRRNTLFDCRRLAVAELAGALELAIETNLRRTITKHCTIYILPRFITQSFNLLQGSLHVIAKDDSAAWEELVQRGYVFDGWLPSRPKQNGRDDLVFTPRGRMDCILAAEDHGTPEGVRFNSLMRFRQLIALLYAVVSDRSPFPIHKSIADPPEFCIQFTHRDSSECTLSRVDCRPLVPVYVEDVAIESTDQAKVAEWYDTLARTSDEVRGRAEKGAHFFNRGMNSDDIEAFINFFISLDAIFGERGSVEASILAGVNGLGVDAKDSERTRWLFELRSELVHGASRYIAEWPKYVRYRTYFRSEPADDVQRIARTAVLHAPYLLGNGGKSGKGLRWTCLNRVASEISCAICCDLTLDS